MKASHSRGLFLAFGLLALLTAAAAWFGYRYLIADSLDDVEAIQREAAIESRVSAINTTLKPAENIATLLAALLVDIRPEGRTDTSASSSRDDNSGASLQLERLRYLIRLPGYQSIKTVGIWPDPAFSALTGIISPELWFTRDGDLLPAVSVDESWDSENWYLVTRHAHAGQCLWTIDSINHSTARCAMPVFLQDGFAAITVTVALSAALLDATGYDGSLLLLDQHLQRFIPRQQPPQLDPALSDALEDRLKAFKSDRQRAIVESPHYSATAVSNLLDVSSSLSRPAAEELLSSAWRTHGNAAAANNAQWELPLNGSGSVRVRAGTQAVPHSDWTLLWVDSSDPLRSTRYLDRQLLVVMIGSLLIALILALAATRWIVIRPMHRLIRRLKEWRPSAEPVVLDERAAGETGTIAALVNQHQASLLEKAYAAAGRGNAKTPATPDVAPTGAAPGRPDSVAVAQTGDRPGTVAASSADVDAPPTDSLTETLHWLRSRSDLLLETDDDAVIVLDERGRIDSMNAVAERLTGLSIEADRGRSFQSALRFKPGDAGDPAARIGAGQTIETEPATLLDSNGESHLCQLLSRPIQVPTQAQPAGHLVRLRVAGQSNTDRSDQGSYDALTGLRDRVMLEQELRLLANASHDPQSPPALLFVDVDNVRRINDIGGHEAGDELLRQMASLLEDVCDPGGAVFFAGGDKFAVLATSSTNPDELAETIRARVQENSFRWGSQDFLVTASAGIAYLSNSGMAPREFIRQADEACSDAKRAGRNCIRTYDSSQQRNDEAEDQKWLRCIQRGLDEDLFHLTTQPIVALQSGTASGEIHEVLIQLEDDDGFWTSPGSFMPVAERHGKIGTIDRWVVIQTLDWLRNNPETLEKLSVCALNISAQSLVDTAFLTHVVEQLEASGVDPRKISFEITEDAVSRNATAIRGFVRTLHSMGCQSSLDVFTAGLASARSLRDMPVNFVKLDGRLTRNLVDEPADRIVIESIHRIASLSGCRTIAEHIDDAALVPILRDIGVDFIQGFAIGRPSPELFKTAGPLPGTPGA